MQEIAVLLTASPSVLRIRTRIAVLSSAYRDIPRKIWLAEVQLYGVVFRFINIPGDMAFEGNERGSAEFEGFSFRTLGARGRPLALIDMCRSNRHYGHKKAGSSEAAIKERRSAGRLRAFLVIRHNAAMSASTLSGRPLASVALK